MSFRGSVRYCCLATLRPRIKLGARFEHATTFSAVFEKVHSISCDENWPKLLLQVVHGTQQPLELAPAEHEDFDLCGKSAKLCRSIGRGADHRRIFSTRTLGSTRRGSRQWQDKRKVMRSDATGTSVTQVTDAARGSFLRRERSPKRFPACSLTWGASCKG